MSVWIAPLVQSQVLGKQERMHNATLKRVCGTAPKAAMAHLRMAITATQIRMSAPLTVWPIAVGAKVKNNATRKPVSASVRPTVVAFRLGQTIPVIRQHAHSSVMVLLKDKILPRHHSFGTIRAVIGSAPIRAAVALYLWRRITVTRPRVPIIALLIVVAALALCNATNPHVNANAQKIAVFQVRAKVIRAIRRVVSGSVPHNLMKPRVRGPTSNGTRSFVIGRAQRRVGKTKPQKRLMSATKPPVHRCVRLTAVVCVMAMKHATRMRAIVFARRARPAAPVLCLTRKPVTVSAIQPKIVVQPESWIQIPAHVSAKQTKQGIRTVAVAILASAVSHLLYVNVSSLQVGSSTRALHLGQKNRPLRCIARHLNDRLPCGHMVGIPTYMAAPVGCAMQIYEHLSVH